MALTKSQRQFVAFLILVAIATLILFIAVLTSKASDINQGYQFLVNEKNITADKLNAIAGAATINTTFFTDKSSAAAGSADTLLYYSATASDYRKTTFGALLFNNSDLITSQNEVTPSTNDFILLYYSASAGYGKSTIDSLFTNAFIDVRPEYTNHPAANHQFAMSTGGGALYRIGLTNIFSEWWRWMRFAETTNTITDPTNYFLSLHTAPTNGDALVIWDSRAQTNRAITLASLATNPPTASVLTNSDLIPWFATATNAANPYGTNPILAKVTIEQLLTNWPALNAINSGLITNVLTNTDTVLLHRAPTAGTNQPAIGTASLAQLIPRFVSFEYPVATGSITSTNHGLPGTPSVVRWVLVNKTTDLEYVPGDEVGVELTDSSGNVCFSGGANATNVFLSCVDATPSMLRKTAGTRTQITSASWKLKCRATYFY